MTRQTATPGVLPTPRTDREVYKVTKADIGFEVVGATLCRMLERELAEAREELAAAERVWKQLRESDSIIPVGEFVAAIDAAQKAS